MLTMLREKGRDEKRHRLVEVQCSYCGSLKVVRQSNLKRSKSCGCVRAARFRAMLAKKKWPDMYKPLPASMWTKYDDSKMTPFQIMREVLGRPMIDNGMRYLHEARLQDRLAEQEFSRTYIETHYFMEDLKHGT